MSIRFELDFYESGGKLILGETRFWDERTDHSAAPTARAVNGDAKELNLPNVQEFSWTRGVRALAVLLLKAMAERNPTDVYYEGSEQSLGKPLAEALRPQRKEKNWILKMFTSPTSHDIRILPKSLFIGRIDYRKKRFRVFLGQKWKDAQFTAGVGSDPQPRTGYLALAERLEREDPEGPKTAESLSADLLLEVWHSGKRRWVEVNERVLPLLPDAQLRITVGLAPPAFPYLIWMTGCGKAQPLYPWKGGDWESAAKQEEIGRIVLPPEANRGERSFFQLDTAPGTETVVLLARDQPISLGFVRTISRFFRDIARRLAEIDLAGSHERYDFSREPDENSSADATRLVVSATGDDPLISLHREITTKLHRRFLVVQGITLATVASLKARV